MEYSTLRDVNRGYMKLRVWRQAMEFASALKEQVWSMQGLDFKLRSQILDSSVSIVSNIAEGYCRRSVKEYIQFLYVSLGSLGETLTRLIHLHGAGFLAEDRFNDFDRRHYELENGIIRLIAALEKKRDKSDWQERMAEPPSSYIIDKDGVVE